MDEKKTDLMQLLSVNNIVPLIGTIVAVIIFVFRLQSGNELITYKIDQLNVKLDRLIEEREVSVNRMRTLTEQRDDDISNLTERLVKVETYLKLP